MRGRCEPQASGKAAVHAAQRAYAYPPPPPPPARPSSYDKVELVWPGKTTEVERVSLPFQTIERVNEVTRSVNGQARLRSGAALPDWWPEGWRNKLIWGDNKYVLSSLLEEFAGKVDLVYIDPPFATGADFSFRVRVGSADIEKQPTILEETAYRDTWRHGINSYLSHLYERIVLSHELLASHGSIFLHLDWRMISLARQLFDEVFGSDRFRNELIWCYYGPSSPGQRQFSRKHDTILWYTKSNTWTFNVDDVRIPYHETTAGKFRSEGTGFGGTEADLSRGKRPEDWWPDIPIVARVRTEILGYPTQKPERLLERMIRAASNPGDVILDFFSGSATAAAVAEKAGRRWLACDLSRFAIHTSRRRLLELEDCRPFEILNLGRYERSHWQGADVGERIGEYYDFIIKLYGADRLDGFHHLHGAKDGRMVHVGATDAPVTAEELELAVEECAWASTLGLDVLGWEWEMGLNPSRKDELAHEYGVDVHLLNIPREVMDQKAVEAGDIHFFELSVVELDGVQDDRGCIVEITAFMPSIDEYMLQKVRGKIERWSDWIDYWSIDFEYDGETFINSWQSYRTRKDSSLSLISDPHHYETAGRKTVVVKVIDIFGNDTTRELTLEVE